MAKKDTLWQMTRPTQAKHTILRKYLDAWLPILGAGRHAYEHVVLIDCFAGPGRYSGGEPGSPLIMLDAYLDHSAELPRHGSLASLSRNTMRGASTCALRSRS